MIDGTLGATVLQKVCDLRLEGLVDSDEIMATLIAAVFAQALRADQTPRQVLDALWETLPSDEEWNGRLHDLVVVAVDLKDSEPA